ncbi:MAG: Rpn family recombination-promoting nuclease/putative transposase [Roseburia sp.]|nr:Rpn family recombination-promoting nuclease/putative transposase [Roseburia sp.]
MVLQNQTDRLIPVVTIVLYHGKEKWNAPRSLSEMLEVDSYPKEIQDVLRSCCNDFRINLVDVNQLASSDAFVTDLKEVFGFLMRQNDREALRNYVDDHEEFTHLRQDAYDVIASLSGTRGFVIKKQTVKAKGEMNMCLAIDEMVQDGVEKGIGKINLLNARLIADGRVEDVVRSAADHILQKKLMEEYGIPRRLPGLCDSKKHIERTH